MKFKKGEIIAPEETHHRGFIIATRPFDEGYHLIFEYGRSYNSQRYIEEVFELLTDIFED